MVEVKGPEVVGAEAGEEFSSGWYLFALSFISLFVELLLIRWIGTEIRIFAYFRNLILISCFIGLGIGFNIRKYRPGLLTTLVLTAVLTAIVHPKAELFGVSFRKIPQYLVFPDFHMWQTAGGTTLLRLVGGYVMVAVIVVLLAAIFIPFGRALGDIFEASKNRIRDYSINLFGALLGTWAFALVSYMTTPPWMWFLAGAGGSALLIRPRSKKAVIGFALMIPILLSTLPISVGEIRTDWSPYQKLRLSEEAYLNKSTGERVPFYTLQINSVLYMCLFDISYEQAQKYPGTFESEDFPYYPYDFPFRFRPEPKSVLIVGAGGGNNAAAAIRNSAMEVDAVEIDPTIARIGRLYHPEKPYDDPRVNLIVDDARSFFKKAEKKYDLILFALLDSHTLTSNFTNINLDSYVYTRESFEEAKKLLTDDGVIAVNFFAERPWLDYKIYSIVEDVFDEPPMVITNCTSHVVHGTCGTMFLCGDLAGVRERIAADPKLKSVVDERLRPSDKYAAEVSGADFDVPSDDWPYIYLQTRKIPMPHLVMIGLMIVMMVVAIRTLFPGKRSGPSHFLFLGAAFMLVEVHSITKAALLFGSTWIVNVVIISAILFMILLANLVALKYKIEKTRIWYIGLFISLAASFLIPVSDLIVGNYLVRGIIAGAFYSLPLFFAGVIFASSIRRVLGVEAAFAANMMGAAIGGMLESASYLIGLKAMVLVAVGLYAASAIALRRMPIRDMSEIEGSQ